MKKINIQSIRWFFFNVSLFFNFIYKNQNKLLFKYWLFKFLIVNIKMNFIFLNLKYNKISIFFSFCFFNYDNNLNVNIRKNKG